MEREVLTRLRERAEKGEKTYGHGVRPGDDTRSWGTEKNDWLEMAEEELLDAVMYVSADYLREFLPDQKEVKINRDMMDCELSNFHCEIMDVLHDLILVCRRKTWMVPKLKRE